MDKRTGEINKMKVEEWLEVEEKNNGFWAPKEGEVLQGILIGYQDGKYGKMYNIETKEGTKTVSSWAILKARMEQVHVGDEVMIEYLGEIKTQNGHAKNFKVHIKKVN